MLHSLKFLLGLEIDISFIKDIAETFNKIIKIIHLFANQKRYKIWGKSVRFANTIHIGTYILNQFYVKYCKIVLIFYMRQAGFYMH